VLSLTKANWLGFLFDMNYKVLKFDEFFGYIRFDQRGDFTMMFLRVFNFRDWGLRVGVAIVACLMATLSIAQSNPAPSVRLRGEVLQVLTDQFVLKNRSGETLTVSFESNVPISEAYPIGIESIKPNAYIGTAALPSGEGSLKALEVLVFPEAARGTGEGHYPWDLQPGSTMTNATVSQLQSKSSGYEIELQYKGGQKTVTLQQGVPIVSIRPGSKALLVTGAQLVVLAHQVEGQWRALRITAGREGFKPPM
jgi:hypothetical protein